MQYKQVLIVRENPGEFQAMINQVSKHNITTWCCVKQGDSSIEGRFERNMYEPHEKVKADAIINNKECNLCLLTIRLAIEQEVTINCGGHIFHEMYTLAEKHEVGVPAKHPNEEYRFVEVDLS